jgi:hypothetical protein
MDELEVGVAAHATQVLALDPAEQARGRHGRDAKIHRPALDVP